MTPHVGRILCDVHSPHLRRVVERSYVLLMYLTINDGTPIDVNVSAMVECVTESKALATSNEAMNIGVNVCLACLSARYIKKTFSDEASIGLKAFCL